MKVYLVTINIAGADIMYLVKAETSKKAEEKIAEKHKDNLIIDIWSRQIMAKEEEVAIIAEYVF